ncbi:MAG: flagellar hook capping FlgD N-terminal domain-containing protein [Verrucomicrobium sp.]|nr:flagellar hook capping FlgD N-terminal domain-containing protein [Verrucomicrobium sp.]
MSVSSVSSTSSSSSSTSTSNSNIGNLSQSDFYKIITTQLQNQNPDDATDTNELLQQMMSLANYVATQNSATNVSSLTNYSTATTLLGKTVDVSIPASTVTSASTVTGEVTDASFSSGGATVTVNGTSYPLSYVTSAYAASSGTGTSSN